ncbi:MAG TPA: sugar phosphate nucleotidyltransferase [Chthoniobacteraceae bacterium]|nr:sugar phosphate nucleotidyltransferase [Chthoniobacteraceae bacterium]
MKAVVLAGGKGARLAPYTTTVPKPLMPLGDKPILDVIIRQLRRHGIEEITLSVGHMAELIMAHFGDGARHGVRIEYSREEEPLGTAGPLSLIPCLNERFLVMNGDILTTLDLGGMLAGHAGSGAICTMAVTTHRVAVDLGVVEYDAQCQLAGYQEKPVKNFRVSMGVYIFEPRALGFIPRARHLDLPGLMHRLMQAGETVRCHPFEGYWLDIGRPDDYARAQADFETIEPLIFQRA